MRTRAGAFTNSPGLGGLVEQIDCPLSYLETRAVWKYPWVKAPSRRGAKIGVYGRVAKRAKAGSPSYRDNHFSSLRQVRGEGIRRLSLIRRSRILHVPHDDIASDTARRISY